MPPWLDTAEEAGALIVGVLGVLGAIGVAILGAVAAVYAAWRSKVKPLLTQTQEAASHAADQLTPNHGSTMRDAVRRIEETVDRLDRTTNQRLGDLRRDVAHYVDQSDRQHSEIFRRLHSLETPHEDTR